MNRPLDLVGVRFGMLVAKERVVRKGRSSAWCCDCDCGKSTIAFTNNLRSGTCTSCGCKRIKHNLSDHYLFAAHSAIRHRCNEPTAQKYADYGGRGIRLADELHDVTTFVRRVLEDIGERPPGTSLDRIDNDGHYEIGNLRWATPTTQNRNRRNLRNFNQKGKTDMPRLKTKVYIASPYTKGDAAVNVKRQLDAVDELMDRGFAPFAPLYSHFQHMAHPGPYEDWIAIDLQWVNVCDVLLRLPGESSGADNEVAHATRIGIPVVHSIDELLRLCAEAA